MSIAILGSGSWGTALAILLGNKGYPVKLWGRRRDMAATIEFVRQNARYLPGAMLPDSVTSTSDLDDALRDIDTVVLALPSTGVREVVGAIKGKIATDVLLVHAGKGLESETGLRGSEVIAEELGEEFGAVCIVLSGPNLAVELANERSHRHCRGFT